MTQTKKLPPLNLNDLIAFANDSYAHLLGDIRKDRSWNTLSIRREGREVELRAIQNLYHRLKTVHEQSAFADPGLPRHVATVAVVEVFKSSCAPTQNDALISHVGESALSLLEAEVFFGFPGIDFTAIPLTLDEMVALRAYLEEKRAFLLNAPVVLRAWSDRFTTLWSTIFLHLPDQMFHPEQRNIIGALALSRPLVQAIEKPKELTEILLARIIEAASAEHNLFRPLSRIIENNTWNVTGVPHDERATTTRDPIFPSECKEPPDRIPALYLSGTPFRPLLDEVVHLAVPQDLRFEHCHIVAGTGHGKTQLMQSMMLADFDDPTRPAVVAIDSQGDMLKTIARLARFDPAIDDRLIILDPADTEWPLRLNLFDVNRDRIAELPRGEREQLLAGIIELYDYIFGALLGAELTQKQSVVFRFLAQLMLAIPDATIHTLRQLLEDPTPYLPYIDQLPPTARTFLNDHLFATAKRGQRPNDYNATRAQVLRRLYGILSNPTFERLFSHPKNALDMKRALDEGKIILVNTGKDVLKAEASAIFGRYVIALIAKAALERAVDAKEERRPTFVYIDEASDYFDDNIDTLLIQARKYNVGITIAHQFLDQLTPALRASVMTNPAIRFAGGLSSKDAASLKEDMRATPEFLLGARKQKASTDFACFARNLTPTAMRFTLPLGQAEREPRMSDGAYDQLLDRVRATIAAPIAETDALLAGTTSPKSDRVAVPAVDAEAYEDRY